MHIASVPTIRVRIFIAGSYREARSICQEYCNKVGLCVTVGVCDYIYTGGSEIGVEVGLINYPRFPTNEAQLTQRAEELGMLLLAGLQQQSFSIVGQTVTTWFSAREQDNG